MNPNTDDSIDGVTSHLRHNSAAAGAAAAGASLLINGLFRPDSLGRSSFALIGHMLFPL